MHTQTIAKRQSIWRRPLGWKAWVVLALISFSLFGWTQGTFDNFLWKVGLNYTDCYQNGFGAVFCGDTAKKYNERIGQTP